MAYRDEKYDLKVQLQMENCELTPAEREKMETDLDSLRKVTGDFPVADLHVKILRHPRAGDVHVKTSLRLPKQTLFTGERDAQVHPAYERCVRKLVKKVKAYKERLQRKSEQERAARGQRQVWPEREPDIAALERAAGEQDYVAFRQAMRVYDDALSHRVGRWIQRYPRAEAMLGREVLLSNVVEEVYLNAFERFAKRPADRLGNWLESLIDASIDALLRDSGDEKKNLSYVEDSEAFE